MTDATAIFAFGLFLTSVGLMTLAYFFRRPAVAIGAFGSWLVTGLVLYNVSTATYDIYWGLFWLCVLMSIICLLEGFVLRPKLSEQEPEEVDESEWDRFNKRHESFTEKLNRRRAMVRSRRIKSGGE